MQLVASVFAGRGRAGDFAWMIEQPEYADTLFVFNDNEGQFRAHQRHAPGARQCHASAGNATIRPYQCQDPPRAAGIPTGDHGGYPALTDGARAAIDDALAAVGTLLATGRYQRLIYSAADDSGALGTGIFEVGDDVKRYIVTGLRALA
jgi:hypothetical protein